MERGASILLVCTVGGSPEPVVAAIKRWHPRRIIFVHSPQTKADIEMKICPKANEEGVGLDPGRYDFFELPDAEDFTGCVDRLRELTRVVREWRDRGEEFQVVVDFTGGTKCMSAALALQASRLPCLFSYVGGTERNKSGVGVVVSGAEKVVHSVNPWDALGYQAIEDFIVLFDQCAFAAAARLAEEAKKRVGREDRKRELNVLEQLAEALEAWDRFDHGAAVAALRAVEKGGNDLRAVLGPGKGSQILDEVLRLARHLKELCASPRPTHHHIVDLLGNARRRWEEGRLDDAVSRLYRAIEASAQVRLSERHGIDATKRVPLERIRESLRGTLEMRADEGYVRLGLQDDYTVLAVLGDPLGEKFRQVGLNRPESVLTARNRSILAHGFERVSVSVVEQLWQHALDLAETTEQELPRFPKLSGSAGMVR